jgi:predicted DNA-binding transcriptional regulator YafY
VASLNRALENREAISIRYTSMTTGDASPQWIAPTHFASDGARIHLRAYSFKHREYRDYLPVRVLPDSSLATKPLNHPLPVDEDWETTARIALVPHESLTQAQARAVRREYDFQGSELVIETRKALEFYADHRWGLDQPDARLQRLRTEYVKAKPTSA